MYVSIVVCTYNRSELLLECLKSLQRMLPDPIDWEVIVVDNNSDDNTESVVSQFMSTFPKLSYVKELKQGLSHARNCGAHSSIAKWIFYIDDDALAHPDLLKRFVQTSQSSDASCIGGKYFAWFREEKPKWWPEGACEKSDPRPDVGPIPMAGLSGGVFAIKKHSLLDVGGFNTNLGMHGKAIGLGEEVEVQSKLIQRGETIIYDPLLQIDHLVAEEKLSVAWHLRMARLNGKNFWVSQKIERSDFYKNKLNMIKLVPDLIKNATIQLFILTYKKDYYWQNWVLDTFLNPIFEYNKFIGKDQ